MPTITRQVQMYFIYNFYIQCVIYMTIKYVFSFHSIRVLFYLKTIQKADLSIQNTKQPVVEKLKKVSSYNFGEITFEQLSSLTPKQNQYSFTVFQQKQTVPKNIQLSGYYFYELIQNILQFQILHLSHHNINSQTRVNIKQALWVHMKGKRLLGQKNSSFSSSNIEFSDQQYTYIQFYLISLMQPLFYSQSSAFKTTIQSEKELQQTNFSRDLFILAAISEQFLLTQHLIQSQFRLSEELKKEKQSSDSGQSSLLGNNNLIHRQSPEDEEDFKFLQEKQNDESPERKSLKKQGPTSRLRVKKVFKYDVDSDSEADKKQSKKCETKNIIKNFVKSIFNFMRKHKAFVIQILEEHKIAQNNFYSYIEEQNGKINTILELRQFWTQNPYSNICRIISCYFLRKYSLKHIFHSRIANHQVHLKYRQKLMRSLRNPKEFSSLKDF